MTSLFSLRFDLHRSNEEGETCIRDTLMVFVAEPKLAPEAFASLMEAEIETNLVPDEVAIIVRDPSFAATRDELTSQSLHQATLGRLGHSTVTLIGYDCMGVESMRHCVAGTMPTNGMTIDDVRRHGITYIFNARRGFVEANATYHFENPSGRHTERFIRLSNILARGAEIAFIGFCCLPHIGPSVTKAYLDTPSLYAVVAAINEQRRSFDGACWILADNFSSYAGFNQHAFDNGDAAVVLISASSSGSLAARLITEKNVEPEHIVHLLYLGRKPSATPVVCDLSQESHANPNGFTTLPLVNESMDCPMCAAGSHAIKLQGDQFEFAGPQQDALLVGLADAPKGLSALMGRYARTEVFEVGLGRSGSKSPRLFHINANKLLASTEFEAKLDYALRRSLPARLSHVIAADQQSHTLATRVAAHLATPASVIARDQIDDISAKAIEAIVIVASVIESGRTLLDISRDLRSIAPDVPLMYLVGMAKTTGEPKRQRLENSLIQTHNFFPYQYLTVDQIVLPASYDNHAWAAELQLLIDPEIRRLVPETLKSTVESRITRLRLASQPMDNDLFLANAAQALSLQPGFVFWPKTLPGMSGHRQADVYITIASVLQQLRANAFASGERRIISNWFQQTILAPGNFGRFNDDVIQASLLRAAYPYELNFADTVAESREMGRLFRRVILASQSPRGGAASEFLLALATRRLQLCKDDVCYVLETEAPDIPMVRFLLESCRHRLS
ncbi:hypothetical protein [Aeromonas veronii]|uniref:hypothetical protein n=1 Tax=Aeromonas veronii TaxID=654 RepID=UPI001FD65DB6|nr:hypothetical protein [Aeromonas veronii]MCJ8220094.1 hypothetical protein [Aeromonas veronii]